MIVHAVSVFFSLFKCFKETCTVMHRLWLFLLRTLDLKV